MHEPNIENYPMDDQIDIQKLFNLLFDGKWIIISTTSLFSIIGVIYSLLLPNIFESKAILTPVQPSSAISGALKGYGGLAGLAGISIPSVDDDGNSAKAIKKIGSLSFFENNIMTNIHLPDLMALKSWNSQENTLEYDQSLYDSNKNIWIREYSYPQKQIPTAQESFKIFIEGHLGLIEDKKSGFIELSIKHQSPFIAKQWTELVVDEINSFYREKDKIESEKAVIYLNQQISMNALSEIEQVLAELLQEEIKKLTLIEANQFYVFDYIDPPAVMEIKSEPKRAFICILSALIGGLLGILIVILRNFFFSK